MGRPPKDKTGSQPEVSLTQPDASMDTAGLDPCQIDGAVPEAQGPKARRQDPDAEFQPDSHVAIGPESPKPETRSTAQVPTQTFLHVSIPKRRRDSDPDEEDGHRDKISRANLALLAIDFNESDLDDDDFETAWALFGSSEISPKPLVSDGSLVKKLIQEPTTYEQAVNDPERGPMWKQAIENEIIALKANGTWVEEVPPQGTNIVTSKWVFKVKYHSDGSVDKFKARLVARGFSQKYGVDYEDTFAPTVKFDTLRFFLAIVAIENLECHQVDVNNAFTESLLKENIYMSPPPGIELPPRMMLHILRSLYGLKQAARDWHQRCVQELLKLGFRQCLSDPCLLVHPVRGIILLVYVDDIGIAARSLTEVNWFKHESKQVFKIKDLDEMKKILGIRITRDRKARTLCMDQFQYIEDVLERLHMRADTHKPISLPLNGYDALRPAGPDDDRIDHKLYQKGIGSVMYAAIHTRPDIAFTVGRLSQYLSDPAKHHGQALKGLLRYLRSTINLRMVFSISGSLGTSGSPKLIGYSDSDYAADKLHRKSILGYVYMLGGGPISWMSRKQKSVATSTTEAEYMAMSICSKEGLWLMQVLKDTGFTEYLGNERDDISIAEDEKHQEASPIRLLGDNQAALTLVRDAHIHDRSKHIQVAYHNVRDLQQRRQIAVEFVPSCDMVADGMTKPLPRDKFRIFIKQLGMKSIKDGGS